MFVVSGLPENKRCLRYRRIVVSEQEVRNEVIVSSYLRKVVKLDCVRRLHACAYRCERDLQNYFGFFGSLQGFAKGSRLPVTPLYTSIMISESFT